ncbi:MAG: zf-HC2 domain-containing protein [Elusimicrobiota bacterium]|nr:zf-HC2 domain-containing protein [Elusimicrobiota bacterium]
MNCEYSEKILLYFYGETDKAQRKEIEDHLNSCADCKESLETLKGVSRHLDASKAAAPEYLIENIIYQARKEEFPKFNISGIFDGIRNHWKIASSTLVFAALMVGMFFPFTTEEVNLNWTSSIDSDLDSLEYSMYEEKDYVFGEYGASVDDFKYEYIDGKIESAKVL